MGVLELSSLDFSAPAETHSFDGLLFDFDGTVVDSTEAIVNHWHKLGKELGVEPDVILSTSHGRRSIDTLQMYDPAKANWEYIQHIEGMIPREFGSGAVEIPGARDTLTKLRQIGAPWAIVTSGTTALVTGWINVLKLTLPQHLVVAEDVARGKPDPECYLLGRERLGLSPSAEILVVEDAPSGIKAGKAAGFKVLALATTHKIDQLKDAGADWIVKNMLDLKISSWDTSKGKVSIMVTNSLKS